MAGAGAASSRVTATAASASYGKAFALLASLFFMWGFITVIDNTLVHGWLADQVGLQNSFWLTVACELTILWYALWGGRVTDALPPERLDAAA